MPKKSEGAIIKTKDEDKGMKIIDAWDNFLSNIRSRVESNVRLEEETFRVDYILALFQTGVAQRRIWPEYPYPKSAANGVDIFVDSGRGEYVEVKYLRELETGNNRPRTKWLGMLLADICRLKNYCGEVEGKFLLLVADKTFQEYLRGQGLALPSVGTKMDFNIKPAELQKTAIAELPTKLIPNIRENLVFSWTARKQISLGSLNVCLLEIE
jgi:hypothetical protein